MTTNLSERTAKGLHESLIEFLPSINFSAPILDLGCGSGAWLDRLGQLGFTNLHGIDYNISNFNTDRATCSQKDLNCDDIGLGEKKFTLITSIEFIEHLEYPGRLFNIVSNYLDEDGYCLLTTPNIHSIRSRLRFLFKGKLSHFDEYGDAEHIYPVLLDALNRMLHRYGLVITKKWGYTSGVSSFNSNKSVMILTEMLQKIIPEEVGGEILCLLIRKK